MLPLPSLLPLPRPRPLIPPAPFLDPGLCLCLCLFLHIMNPDYPHRRIITIPLLRSLLGIPTP